MGWTERVDSMLQARGRRAIKCTGLTAFFVAVAIDAAAVVLLREAPALVEELKDEPLVDPPLWTPAASHGSMSSASRRCTRSRRCTNGPP